MINKAEEKEVIDELIVNFRHTLNLIVITPLKVVENIAMGNNTKRF